MSATELPDHFRCPITRAVMKDPVVLEDGVSYERIAIETWLEKNNRSPMTNQDLVECTVTPNHSLRAAIRHHIGEMAEEEATEEDKTPDIAIPSEIPLRINCVTGMSFDLDLEETATLSDLKDAIESEKGIPQHQQRLIYRGRELTDSVKSIKDLGLHKNSLINLVLRCVGGF